MEWDRHLEICGQYAAQVEVLNEVLLLDKTNTGYIDSRKILRMADELERNGK